MTWRVSYKKRNRLPFASTYVHPRVLLWVHLFNFLCFVICRLTIPDCPFGFSNVYIGYIFPYSDDGERFVFLLKTLFIVCYLQFVHIYGITTISISWIVIVIFFTKTHNCLEKPPGLYILTLFVVKYSTDENKFPNLLIRTYFYSSSMISNPSMFYF
jgi:hypothetical protein